VRYKSVEIHEQFDQIVDEIPIAIAIQFGTSLTNTVLI